MCLNSSYDDSVAANYDKVRSWGLPIPSRVVRIGRIGPSSRVLDVGCGTGNLMAAIRGIADCSCVGVDLSGDMLRVAGENLPDAVVVQADVAGLPFSEGSFDCAVGSFFLHHVPHHWRLRAIKECHRVLTKGLLIIVSRSYALMETSQIVRFFPEVLEIDKERFPSISEICEWLERAGFTDIGSEVVKDDPYRVDEGFLSWVAKRPISTLSLIGEDAFERGLARVRERLRELKGAAEICERAFSLVFGKKDRL